MTAIDQLYYDLITDHGRQPRNLRQLEDASHVAVGDNQLCGDEINLSLKIVDNIVEDAAFTGHGCAICLASVSVLTEEIKGKTVSEVQEMISNFRSIMTSPITEAVTENETLTEKLQGFQIVRAAPMRVKCVLLSWYALTKALEG